AAQMHQAAEVTAHEAVGARGGHARELALEHAARDLRLLHREQPAEAAALVLVLHLRERHALDAAEQRERRLAHTEPPQEMAGRVIRDPRREPRATRHPRPLRGQELAELAAASGDRMGLVPPRGL